MQNDAAPVSDPREQNAGVDIFIRPTAEYVAKEYGWNQDESEDDDAIALQIGIDTYQVSVDLQETFEVPTGHEGAISDREEDEHEVRPEYIPLADADGKALQDLDTRGFCLSPGRYLYDGATVRVVELYPEEERDDDF